MRRAEACVTFALLALAACAPSRGGLPDTSLKLQPDVSNQHAAFVSLTLVVDGERSSAEVDTGSIYAFVGHPDALTCSNPSTFHWGAGYAEFCESTAPFNVSATDGSTVELDPALEMGRAKFTGWSGPDAIIGLSANMKGENIGDLKPVIEQLNPDFLSFRFPGGPLNDGIMQFAPLPPDTLGGVSAVPLVDPGSLEYGYTANISRVDFIADHEVRASIVTEPSGVYLEIAENLTKIAEENLAFFDTGATEPYVPINGDISLLSDHVSDAVIFPKGKEPYDEIRFTLDVGGGDHVVLSNDEIRTYGTGEPGLALPTVEDFPSGMKQLTTVVGLGTLAGYDFQFTFEDGRATEVRFAEP